MEGMYSREKGTLHIGVSNVPEFEKLISQAHEEAKALMETIERLKWFDLEIDITSSGSQQPQQPSDS